MDVLRAWILSKEEVEVANRVRVSASIRLHGPKRQYKSMVSQLMGYAESHNVTLKYGAQITIFGFKLVGSVEGGALDVEMFLNMAETIGN